MSLRLATTGWVYRMVCSALWSGSRARLCVRTSSACGRRGRLRHPSHGSRSLMICTGPVHPIPTSGAVKHVVPKYGVFCEYHVSGQGQILHVREARCFVDVWVELKCAFSFRITWLLTFFPSGRSAFRVVRLGLLILIASWNVWPGPAAFHSGRPSYACLLVCLWVAVCDGSMNADGMASCGFPRRIVLFACCGALQQPAALDYTSRGTFGVPLLDCLG